MPDRKFSSTAALHQPPVHADLGCSRQAGELEWCARCLGPIASTGSAAKGQEAAARTCRARYRETISLGTTRLSASEAAKSPALREKQQCRQVALVIGDLIEKWLGEVAWGQKLSAGNLTLLPLHLRGLSLAPPKLPRLCQRVLS